MGKYEGCRGVVENKDSLPGRVSLFAADQAVRLTAR